MAKKKTTRKALLNKQDEFLTFSSKAVNFFNTHLRLFRYLGLAVGVIVIVYLAAFTYMRHVNKKGQEAYNMAYYTLTENMKSDPGPEELKRSEELFGRVMEEYSLSKAARFALPQVAYLKFTDKKYDEAIDLYREFLDGISGDDRYESLARLALAACYEAKGDLKEAIATLSLIVEHPEDLFKDTAMFSLARLFRLEGNIAKEKELLKEFVEKYKDSPFLPMAKARL